MENTETEQVKDENEAKNEEISAKDESTEEVKEEAAASDETTESEEDSEAFIGSNVLISFTATFFTGF